MLAELRKAWDESKPHIEIATLCDWFASYVFLPRSRDDATLTLAVEKLVGKLDGPVAFARSSDQQSGRYEGVSRWAANLGANVASGLLVWRLALRMGSTYGGGFDRHCSRCKWSEANRGRAAPVRDISGQLAPQILAA